MSLIRIKDEAIDMILDLGYGLVAYEMGLGKTMVGIAVVEELLVKPEINFAMIVVPSGLKYQWAESIAKFTDVATTKKKVKKEFIDIPTEDWCVVVDGSPAKRKEQYRFIEKNWPNYVIVSYEQVVSDFRSIKRLGAECIILDEATAIKGFKAQRSKKVKELDPEFAVALSGTPLENRPEEVYSIMEFVNPAVLGRFDSFDTKYIVRNGFGGVTRYRNLDIFHEKLSRVMSRKTRLDPDVAPYMPKVAQKNEYIHLSRKTKKLYDKIAKMIVNELAEAKVSNDFNLAAYYAGEGGSDMTATGRIMAKMMALQMLCDHPDLLKVSGQKYFDSQGEEGSKFAAQLLDTGELEDLGKPEKFLAVIEDVQNILESNPDNKVIIFTFFKPLVQWIQEALEDYDTVIYTGDMNVAQKAEAKARYQQNPDCRVFIATDAGRYGVDLPQANYLINFDLAESAGKMDQGNARHVRAGSKHKNVFVINYLIEGSIEERTYARLEFKRTVSRAVVDGEWTGFNGELENSVETLTSFLDSVG